jgi:glycine cleavage system H protein
MSGYPTDRGYTRDHEWIATGQGAGARIGITGFAAEALGDIVYVALPALGQAVTAGEAVAELESTKSVSEVFAPVTGVVTAVNQTVMDAPETINADPYGAGWLFEVELADPGQLEGLLDASAYQAGLG